MAREPADQPAISLVLGESEGRIAVMTADGQIYALLDRYTETLPHSERNRLRRGIPISNGQELGELLEGYES